MTSMVGAPTWLPLLHSPLPEHAHTPAGPLDVGTWIGLLLMATATVAGALLARRQHHRAAVVLAIASGMMLITAVTEVLPDAWHEAGEAGLATWAVVLAAVTGYLVMTLVTRNGCGCEADLGSPTDEWPAPSPHHPMTNATASSLFTGMGTAAALSLHRIIEGAALGLTTSVAIIAALVVHSGGEGLALAAVLHEAKQRLAPWLVLACISPIVGMLISAVSPLPPTAIAVLLAVVAGVLLRIAAIGLKLVARKQRVGLFTRRHMAFSAGTLCAVGTLPFLSSSAPVWFGAWLTWWAGQ